MALAFKTLTGAAAIWSMMTIAATHRDVEAINPNAPPPPVAPTRSEPSISQIDFKERWPEPVAAPSRAEMPKTLSAPKAVKHERRRFHCERRYYYRGKHRYWRCQR